MIDIVKIDGELWYRASYTAPGGNQTMWGEWELVCEYDSLEDAEKNLDDRG